MNEELIRQWARESFAADAVTEAGKKAILSGSCDDAPGVRFRYEGMRSLYYSHVAPLVEAVKDMIADNGIECIPDALAQRRITTALAAFGKGEE